MSVLVTTVFNKYPWIELATGKQNLLRVCMFMLRNVNVDFGTESSCIPRPIMSMGIHGVVEWKKRDVIFCHSSAADFTLGRPDAD